MGSTAGGGRGAAVCRGAAIQASIVGMSVLAATPPTARPELAELLARADGIAKLARERARQTEADRRISAEMTERMREADLFRVMQPAAYGGFEYGFDDFFPIVAAVARGCGSTGWVYGLLAS